MLFLSSVLAVGVTLAAIALNYYETPLSSFLPWSLPLSLSDIPRLLGATTSGTYYSYVDQERFHCRPFLPHLFSTHPPSISDPSIKAASQDLHKFLSKRFAKGDIDSLSVAVVTSEGAIFEENWGVLRANESVPAGVRGGKERSKTTSDSVYRIASVAKFFVALEGHILVQRGVISWSVNSHSFIMHTYAVPCINPSSLFTNFA